MSDLISAGWPTVALDVLLTDVQPGFASGKHNSSGEGVPHFRPMNVSTSGWIDRNAVKYVDPLAGRPELRLRRGDVVFNNTNSPELVGKTALFDDDDAPAFSNHMTRLRVDTSRLDPGFLALRLHQAWREGWFAAHCNNHVSQASIGRDVLRAFEIELPPLDVQQAIQSLSQAVADSRVSSTSHLAAARRAIGRFREAVLAAACSGRLTAEWRIEIGIADDPTDDVPGGWSKGTLDDLGEWRTGGTPSRHHPEYFGGDVPWVKSGDLRDGPVKATEEKLTPEALKNSSAKLMPVGTVSVALYGATIGRLGVLEIEAATNQACANCVPNGSVVDRWFLFYYLLGQRRGLVAAGQGGAQPNLTNRIVRDWPIALPPIEEQHEIVRRVDQFLALADVLRQRIEVASTRIDRSSQAVLARALRGDLTVFDSGRDGEPRNG